MKNQQAANVIRFFSLAFWIIPVVITLCVSIFLFSRDDVDFFPHNYIVDITSFSTCYEAQEEGLDGFVLSKRFLVNSDTIHVCGYLINETPHKPILFGICWFEINSKGALSCTYPRYEFERGEFYSDLNSSELAPGKYRVEVRRARETLIKSVFTIVPTRKERAKIRR